jgi:hypothetical protein
MLKNPYGMMKIKLRLFAVILGFYSIFGLTAQNRITDENQILWAPVIISTKINEKVALYTEYQWRRNNLGETWQQSLLRLGLTYNANKTTAFQAGYGWILTYPYGDYPLAPNGTFTEHRIYQQALFKVPLNAVGTTLISRIRLEQRWLAVLNTDKALNHWNYLNRARIMQRLNFPFKVSGKDCYASLMDEVFIGFGRNVGQNVFDQNRLYGLLGWNVNEKVQLELGVFNQILQQGKLVTAKPVFQYNSGPVFGLNLKL